jgi:hypothetical protein
MIGRTCLFIGVHHISQNFTRNGLRILAVLALALTLTGTSPSRSVQASPAAQGSGQFAFVMQAFPSANFVCVGQTMTIRVSIFVQVDVAPGATQPGLAAIRGNLVTANVRDGSGTIMPAEGRISSPNELVPGSVTFTFKAGSSPGRTTLEFKSQVSSFFLHRVVEMNTTQNVGTTATIDVRNCTYKVNMLQLMSLARTLVVTGVADEAILGAETDARFRGSTSLRTSAQSQIQLKFCAISGGYIPGGIEIKVDNSTVDYTIDVTGDRLYFNAVIAPHTITSTDPCSGRSFSFPMGGSNPQPFILPVGGGVIVIRSPFSVTTFIIERVATP